jgi:hypothetical protein
MGRDFSSKAELEKSMAGYHKDAPKYLKKAMKPNAKKPTPLAHSWNGRQVSKKEFETLTRQKAIVDKNKAHQGTSTGYMVNRPQPAMPPATIPMGAPPQGAGVPAPAPMPQGGAPVRMPTPKRPPASSAQLPDDNMNAIA